MSDFMPKKDYDLTEITRLLLEMRDNCVPKAGDAHDDPKRDKKYDALNAAIDLINNPSMLAKWISVKDRLPEDLVDVLVWFEYFRYGSYNCLYRTIGIGSVYQGNWGFINGTSGWQQLKVMAWMPLPEPPKEE